MRKGNQRWRLHEQRILEEVQIQARKAQLFFGCDPRAISDTTLKYRIKQNLRRVGVIGLELALTVEGA